MDSAVVIVAPVNDPSIDENEVENSSYSKELKDSSKDVRNCRLEKHDSINFESSDQTNQIGKKRRKRVPKILCIHSCKRIPGMIINFLLHTNRMILRRFLMLLLVGLLGLGIFYVSVSEKKTPHSKRHNRMIQGQFPGYRDCLPSQKIGFMKTHKCASTTIQNILMRYGLEHDLNFVLPLTGHYLGKTRTFDKSMLMGTLWNQANLGYNIFCQHTRWDQEQVSEVLGLGAVFISIVRDPVDLFISLWDYGQMGQVIGISLEDFALMKQKTGRFTDRMRTGNLGQNQMLWDFGLDHKYLNNETAIAAKIQEIDANFDLIMVAERFDESIVLLREELCWDFRDVTSLKLNARKKSINNEISSSAREALKKWLWGDYMLYDYFLERFSEKVEQFGQKNMEKQLNILRHANEHLMNRCVEQQVDSRNLPEEQQLWGKHLIGYKLKDDNDTMCHYLTLKEVSFVNEIREVMSERSIKYLESNTNYSKSDIESQAYNPKKFEMHLKKGMPDIEAMKKVFPFKGP